MTPTSKKDNKKGPPQATLAAAPAEEVKHENETASSAEQIPSSSASGKEGSSKTKDRGLRLASPMDDAEATTTKQKKKITADRGLRLATPVDQAEGAVTMDSSAGDLATRKERRKKKRATTDRLRLMPSMEDPEDEDDDEENGKPLPRERKNQTVATARTADEAKDDEDTQARSHEEQPNGVITSAYVVEEFPRDVSTGELVLAEQIVPDKRARSIKILAAIAVVIAIVAVTAMVITLSSGSDNNINDSSNAVDTSLATQFQWIQMGADLDGEAAGDWFGWSVSLSSDGDRVAIGAYRNDGNGSNSGHVRIFEWSGSVWTQMGADLDGEAAGDWFGDSISLSSNGDRVAIGAINNDGNGSNSGHVRVFEWSGSAWIQMGADLDGEAADDSFGESVSLSSNGNRVTIGAIYNDGNGVDSGRVRIFEWSGSAWIQMGADLDGEAAGDWFGWSVSLSSDGDRVAIGAYRNDGNGSNSGHVRIFEWSGSAWIQMGADLDGEAAGDNFGWSVSLSSNGDRVAVGAIENADNGVDSGHVRIFEWSGGSAWIQMGADLDGEAADDYFGDSVSLSSDGNRVAIGATFNDGNGSNSGHVRIFEWSGSAWIQMGADLDGEAPADEFGGSVSLSSDGTRVAIGAIWNDDNGTSSGHVRIFDLAAAGR